MDFLSRTFRLERTPAYLSLNFGRQKDHLLGQEKSTDDESEPDSEAIYAATPRRRCSWLTPVLFTALIATNAFSLIGYWLKTPSDSECTDQLSIWSPMNVAVEYEERDFENPFAHKTIYRGPPTMELEEAWADLWFYDGVRVPEDKLHFLNRSTDLGGGRTLKPVNDTEGGYHSLFEVFHQIHCLNLVRQYTWRDWYFRHPDIVPPPADLAGDDVSARMHADHCIEALRLSLMCHADSTPYLVILDPTAPQGTRADFSPHHKCRNFEKVRQWTEDNQLSNPRDSFSPLGRPAHSHGLGHGSHE